MSDVMRQTYRPLSDQEKADMNHIKECGRIFYDTLDAIGSGREIALAKTKIEEAVMWATKHITR